MRAEEWWKCYSTMIPALAGGEGPESVYRGVLRFLEECKGSVIGREGKVKRVKRAWAGARRVLEALYRDPSYVVEHPDTVADALRRALGERAYTKTVVFSVKMAYYAARTIVGRVPLRSSLPIPVDVRVACATYSSGMVEGPGYRGLVSRPEPAREAWRGVSEITGIPELHLDTVAWLAGWAPRDLSLDEARSRVAALLSRVASPTTASRIAGELCRRRCED
jgi:DNA-(apurinic or apyrimidinic site) lyase